MTPGPNTELESLDMIRRLVGFDTTSRESNLALIDFVRGYLADLVPHARVTERGIEEVEPIGAGVKQVHGSAAPTRE